MSHALHALEALSQTRMICHHTASQLIAAFRNEQCTICSAFGPYLHLMTCERVCWQCLERNRTLRVIPRETASEAFALSDEQVRQLPTIFTTPGRYGGTQTPNRYRYELVSVRAAIELAITVHGSLESVSEAFRGRTHTGILAYEERDLQAALDVVASGKYDALFTQPEDRDMFRLGPEDWHFGKASIPFPSLTSSRLVEDGLFCDGCRWMSTKRPRFPESFPESAVDRMVPPGCDPHSVLSGLKRRAYSRVGFLEHTKHCYGAKQLICSWKDGK